MKLSVFGIRIVGAMALALLSAGPASAQRADGPFAGLFGGDHDSSRVKGGSSQSLDLSGSLFGAYDEILTTPAGPTAPADPGVQTSGTSEGASGSLSYERRADHVQFLLNGGTSLREYSSDPSFLASSYSGRTSLATALGKVGINVTGGATYSPFYQLVPFLDAGAAFATPLTSSFDLATVKQKNVSLNGAVGITDNFSRRSSFTASLTGQETRLLDSSSNDVNMWGAAASFQHRITRALGFHMGYGQNEVRYAFADAPSVRGQTIDAGLDYGGSLAFSRRTTFSFSTSTSALRLNGETHYLVNGAATLTRGFKRSWTTSLGYTRGVSYVPGFRDPVQADSVNAVLGGQLARRLQWSSGVGYSRGAIGFSGAGTLDTFTATSSLNFGLTRGLGVYTQYAYYRYEAPVGSNGLTLLPVFARQAVSAGFSLWVPILNTRGGSR